MTIEKTHGKLLPTRPRSSDLVSLPEPVNAAPQRDASGRFLPGNDSARLANAKAAERRLSGTTPSELDRDSAKLAKAMLGDLGPDAPPTARALMRMAAREAVVAARIMTEAERLGLTTPEGLALSDKATAHTSRAERLVISALDCGRVIIAARRSKTHAMFSGGGLALPTRSGVMSGADVEGGDS